MLALVHQWEHYSKSGWWSLSGEPVTAKISAWPIHSCDHDMKNQRPYRLSTLIITLLQSCGKMQSNCRLVRCTACRNSALCMCELRAIGGAAIPLMPCWLLEDFYMIGTLITASCIVCWLKLFASKSSIFRSWLLFHRHTVLPRVCGKSTFLWSVLTPQPWSLKITKQKQMGSETVWSARHNVAWKILSVQVIGTAMQSCIHHVYNLQGGFSHALCWKTWLHNGVENLLAWWVAVHVGCCRINKQTFSLNTSTTALVTRTCKMQALGGLENSGQGFNKEYGLIHLCITPSFDIHGGLHHPRFVLFWGPGARHCESQLPQLHQRFYRYFPGSQNQSS